MKHLITTLAAACLTLSTVAQADKASQVDPLLVKAGSDLVAALQCKKAGYPLFERIDSQYVTCLYMQNLMNNAVSVEVVLHRVPHAGPN